MRKKDLIKHNTEQANKIFNLGREIESLNKKIYIYKKALEITRDFYGEKLVELEQRRLLLDHPDIVVDEIVWDSIEDITSHESLKYRKYKFIYSIRGERQ